jgi:hypothetical protein
MAARPASIASNGGASPQPAESISAEPFNILGATTVEADVALRIEATLHDKWLSHALTQTTTAAFVFTIITQIVLDIKLGDKLLFNQAVHIWNVVWHWSAILF